MGQTEDAYAASDSCSVVFRELYPSGSFSSLNQESVDELVAFWSR